MPFEKGNKRAEGNDKGLSLSNWIDRELEKQFDTSTLKGYEDCLNAKKVLARMVVEKTIKANTLKDFLDGLEFITDRTEGKPKQSIEAKVENESVIRFTVED